MSKEDLLKELANYVDLETGRKRRTDKGVVRGAYKIRGKDESAMSIYNRVKARVTNKHQEQQKEGQYLLEGFDSNGFYYEIPASYTTVYNPYIQNVGGRKIEHTTRRVPVQKAIDLERYRFNAWQEYARDIHKRDILVEITPDIRGILLSRGYMFTNDDALKEFIERNHITYLDWFAYVYYISLEDVSYWTYDMWREHYRCCGDLPLDSDFQFNLNYKPGSEQWHPEFKADKERIERQRERDRQEAEERKSTQFIANMQRRQK